MRCKGCGQFTEAPTEDQPAHHMCPNSNCLQTFPSLREQRENKRESRKPC